jgi:predicted metal-dependent hydrolase
MSKAKVVATAVGPARLRRSSRKTLAISVQPDGSIELTAPARARVEDVIAKVVKRAAWIHRQQRDFAAMNARRPPRRYSSGATHRYLGRQYRLKVSHGRATGVKLAGAYFHVVTNNGTKAEVEEQLASWMRERALNQLSRRVDAWREWCQRHRLPAARIHLRSMPKRWGSARRDGRIWFNPDLVRAPSVCIDYVVAHEICHLKYPTHAPAFYRQLDQLFPNWRAIKRRLESAEL